jgi:hypothetical protein
VSRIWQLTVIALAAVSAALFGGGPAFAARAPLDPEGTAGTPPIVIERAADSGLTSLWTFALVAVVAAALTAIVLVALAGLARRRHSRGIALAT